MARDKKKLAKEFQGVYKAAKNLTDLFETVDNRCAAADGAVTQTVDEITDAGLAQYRAFINQLNAAAFRCDICKGSEPGQRNACPCGNLVCSDCEDTGIYSDETCCKKCAAEIRKGWKNCGTHEYKDEPYENEDGAMIQECAKCSFPKLLDASA